MCSLSGSAPPKGLGGQITPKSGIFFKILSETARPNALKVIRGPQGVTPFFGNGHQNVIFSRAIRPIRIKFCMKCILHFVSRMEEDKMADMPLLLLFRSALIRIFLAYICLDRA